MSEMGGTTRDVPSFLWPDARLNLKKGKRGSVRKIAQRKRLLFIYITRVEWRVKVLKTHTSDTAAKNLWIFPPNLI